MSFSAGVYTLPNPALVPGQTVASTENNAFRNDVAGALNLTMLRNGTSTATANLPMGGYKLTGLGAATTNGDALSYGAAAVVSNLTDTALTATRVPYAGTGGLLQDASTFTFDGTTLTAAGFSGPLTGNVTGNVSGNAGTVTNGVYTTGSYADPSWITSIAGSKVSGNISGNAATATTATNQSGGTVAATTGSFSSSVTLSGGTANGVAYLNGSKVLTTGSALTFDGSNLGLGVTPSAWGTLSKAFELGAYASVSGNSSTGGAYLANNAILSTNNDSTGWLYKNSDGATLYKQGLGTHKWYTAPSGTAGNAISFTQAMTLDASGNLLVGTTSPLTGNPVLSVKQAASAYLGTFQHTVNDDYTLFRLQHAYAQSTQQATMLQFCDSTGNERGTIKTNGTTTSYNTSSDYRLKENIQPMQNALGVVAQLNPVTYTWKADGSDGQGFIAHELQAVVPDCVTGEKDAVDADGKPVYQGVDTSFLVATLTAAIKELKAELDATKADVAALKAIN